MPRTVTVRSQLAFLARRTPFKSFAVTLESGADVIVEHPENVAFDASEKGVDLVTIISKGLVYCTSLSAITGVVALDTGTATS